MARRILLKNALVVATMDDTRREVHGGFILTEGPEIRLIGSADDALPEADEVIDLSGHVVLPGLVNTHHHMVQSLTRATPGGQDAELFGWLKAHYPIWANLTPEMIRISAATAMSELVLSGCTTSSDHLYIYPNGARLDDAIEAAREVGIRFHAARGAMSVGESKGGLPPDRVVEEEPAILKEMQRLIEDYHDAGRFAMLRIVIAPCSPFTVSEDLMRESAKLARAYGVTLHTHLAENDSDISYSLEVFGKEPVDYAEGLGWLGPDVWHAHCVKLDTRAIKIFADTGTGVAHCPCSNMRLASGIAPVRQMRDAGMNVGLGVDGSASADAGHLLAEARQCMLLQRVGFGPQAMGAREALEIATRGGAKVLGRDDIGYLAPNMAADIVAFDMRTIDFAGAMADPVAALVFCTPAKAAWSLINGRIVVREGQLVTLDLARQVETHNRLSKALIAAAR